MTSVFKIKTKPNQTTRVCFSGHCTHFSGNFQCEAPLADFRCGWCHCSDRVRLISRQVSISQHGFLQKQAPVQRQYFYHEHLQTVIIKYSDNIHGFTGIMKNKTRGNELNLVNQHKYKTEQISPLQLSWSSILSGYFGFFLELSQTC